MNIHVSPATALSDREENIDSAYAASAVLNLIAHAADTINAGELHADGARRLARDIRRSAELVEEMVSNILEHLEQTGR